MPKKAGMEKWKKKRRQEHMEQKLYRYYIFCEGQQTEPAYFTGFKKLIEENPVYKDMVLVEIEPCQAETMRVIGMAEDYVKKNKIKKGQIWCVYDRDRLKAGDILFAMGNSDVPVGQYTQKIFAFYELDEEALAKAGLITYGTNVKEVTTQVKEGSVDCGVVYATDAFSAGLTIVDTATKDMCGQVIYPAAVLKISKNPEAAQAFLDYLTGPEATAVFEAVGFSPMS